ncbi:DNA sulfur modification protein DndE [Xanthomonas sp. NCPPB 1325]|uniref:DNA sulfur modification protein DndE n=1 Tax=Xanthomonas sp. NCPPB 1325 TaxID=487529 RepID=UPI0035563123
MIDTLRLSDSSKDQLMRLRRSTGIKHWNALCRWALCKSLSDPRPVGASRLVAASSVELSWKVLTGDYGEVYLALLKQRCAIDGCASDDAALTVLLRRHVYRGIAMLASGDSLPDLHSLCQMAISDIK